MAVKISPKSKRVGFLQYKTGAYWLKLGFALFVVLFVVIVGAGALLIVFLVGSAPELRPDFPATNVKQVTPGYLSSSKISLLSAIPRYGFWRLNDTHIGFPPGGPYTYVMHNGDPIFIINVTIRNDYLPKDAGSSFDPNAPIGNITGRYASFIILNAKLYGKNNSLIPSVDVTQPIDTLMGHEFSLQTGETTSFDMLLSTLRQDVDHYEISISYLASAPQP